MKDLTLTYLEKIRIKKLIEKLGKFNQKTRCPFYTFHYILNWYIESQSCFNLIYDLIKFVNINEEDYTNIIKFIIKHYIEYNRNYNYNSNYNIIPQLNEFYNKYKFNDFIVYDILK